MLCIVPLLSYATVINGSVTLSSVESIYVILPTTSRSALMVSVPRPSATVMV
jgi:hypothetical protein